jgi:hypothetical protein
MSYAEDRQKARARNRQRRERTGIFSYVDESKLTKMGITQYKAKTNEDTERNKILLLPPKKYKEYSIGIQVWRHTQIGQDNRTLLCPFKMELEDSCPICENAKRLRDEGVTEQADQKVARRRYLYFVVDVSSRDNRRKGMRWYDAPLTFDEEIEQQAVDANGVVFDPASKDEPKVLLFRRTGTGARNTKYKGFKLVDYTGPYGKDWNPPDFMDVLKVYTYEELRAFETGVDEEDDGGDMDEENATKDSQTNVDPEDSGQPEDPDPEDDNIPDDSDPEDDNIPDDSDPDPPKGEDGGEGEEEYDFNDPDETFDDDDDDPPEGGDGGDGVDADEVGQRARDGAAASGRGERSGKANRGGNRSGKGGKS